ncbi:MAG TPA: hypothetical protein VN031_03925 [Candidatus Microsaccharimonas sp.]|nr:hypothetical protein [Candidatus Microsaccharimonas sp.]
MSKQGVRLTCFSSPVMLATFAIETVLAMYTLWRYRLSALVRLVVLSLLALGFFQLAEYHVCTGGEGLSAATWSRAGFVAITLLPALGLHMLHVLAKKRVGWLIAVAYASMVSFVGYFLFETTAFKGYACTGNYVIFQIGRTPALWYALYYYGWLLMAFILGVRWANQLVAEQGREPRKRLEAVRGLMVGYLVFLVPTVIANTVNPETRRGIPSVMCGFAVLFALILTLYILPRLAQRRR